MKLLFSVPTGYHLRELLLPLHSLLESDTDVTEVHIFTPGAPFRDQIFGSFSLKFHFVENPKTLTDHIDVIKAISPDVVITNTVGHDELDYPILKAASELSIPTVTFIASWDNVWKIERLVADKQLVHIADRIIVWNKMMMNHLQRVFPSLAAEKISVIGAPRLDYFWQTEKIPSKAELYDYLGFTDTALPLIHFPTTELYPMDYVVAAIATAIKNKQLPTAHLYASVHPGGNLDNHAELKQYGALVRYSFGRVDNPLHPAFAYVPTEKELFMLTALFTHADVLVNHSSTTAIESLAGNTPVINVQYGRPLDWWRWHRSMVYRDFKEHYMDLLADNATYVVTHKDELINATKSALSSPQAKEKERQLLNS